MSELKPNSRHLREVLLFYFNVKESADWLRFTGLSHRILMVKRLLVTPERVDGDSSNVLRVVILLSKTGMVVDGRKKLLKMQNWRRANLSEDSCRQTQEELSESLGGDQ
nr:hypothetical transcript [Hymenolepis microstoma]